MLLAGVERLLGVCEQLFLVAANALLAVMLTINLVNIASRMLFDRGLVWVFPWTTVMFVWMTFLGFFVVYRRAKDITVEFAIDRLGAGARQASRLFVDLAVLSLMGVLLWEAPDLLARQVGTIEMVGLQRYWLSVPLFVSCVLIALHFVADLAAALAGRPEPHHTPAGDI